MYLKQPIAIILGIKVIKRKLCDRGKRIEYMHDVTMLMGTASGKR